MFVQAQACLLHLLVGGQVVAVVREREVGRGRGAAESHQRCVVHPRRLQCMGVASSQQCPLIGVHMLSARMGTLQSVAHESYVRQNLNRDVDKMLSWLRGPSGFVPSTAAALCGITRV